MTSEVNITDPLNTSLLHHHDNTDIGNATSVPEIHWVRWVDILVGSVGLTIGLYSLIVNIIILAVLVRMSRRYDPVVNILFLIKFVVLKDLI